MADFYLFSLQYLSLNLYNSDSGRSLFPCLLICYTTRSGITATVRDREGTVFHKGRNEIGEYIACQ